MTAALQAQVVIAAFGIFALLVLLVLTTAVGSHILNEMVQQARAQDGLGKLETNQQAREAFAIYKVRNPSSSLRKAQKLLVVSSAFVWTAIIALLVIIWSILANRISQN